MICAALLVACCAVVGPVLGRNFEFYNQRDDTVWIGTLGNVGHPAPNDGGFILGSGDRVKVTTADNWAGRFWARTGCNFNGDSGHCDTGDCGNKLACNGAGGVPPVSLAEFNLGTPNGDFYDVSFVDGYNVGLQITPQNQGCVEAGCLADLNSNCPTDLLQTNSAGDIVGCKSACRAFGTDQYCCRGAYGTADTCNPATWPQGYVDHFNKSCPNAYSYAYDDPSSLFTCPGSDYTITVG